MLCKSHLISASCDMKYITVFYTDVIYTTVLSCLVGGCCDRYFPKILLLSQEILQNILVIWILVLRGRYWTHECKINAHCSSSGIWRLICRNSTRQTGQQEIKILYIMFWFLPNFSSKPFNLHDKYCNRVMVGEISQGFKLYSLHLI